MKKHVVIFIFFIIMQALCASGSREEDTVICHLPYDTGEVVVEREDDGTFNLPGSPVLKPEFEGSFLGWSSVELSMALMGDILNPIDPAVTEILSEAEIRTILGDNLYSGRTEIKPGTDLYPVWCADSFLMEYIVNGNEYEYRVPRLMTLLYLRPEPPEWACAYGQNWRNVDDSKTKLSRDTQIEEDIVYDAYWFRNEAAITLNMPYGKVSFSIFKGADILDVLRVNKYLRYVNDSIDGWTYDEAAEEYVAEGAEVEGDLELWPHFSGKYCIVTYSYPDGTSETVPVTKGKRISESGYAGELPEHATDFLGWRAVGEERLFNFIQPVKKDIFLEPVFKLKRYTVSFALNDIVVGTMTVPAGMHIYSPTFELPHPYSGIVEWSIAPGGELYDFSEPVYSDIVLHGTPEYVDVEVVFNLEEPVMASVPWNTPVEEIIPDELPEGVESIDHWETADGERYDFSSSVKERIVLDPVWRMKECSVSFSMGEDGSREVEVPYGTVIPEDSIPAAENTSRPFLWWSSGILPFDASEPVKGDIILHPVLYPSAMTIRIAGAILSILVCVLLVSIVMLLLSRRTARNFSVDECGKLCSVSRRFSVKPTLMIPCRVGKTLVTSIGSNFMEEYAMTRNISIPAGVSHIERNAFSNLRNLESVEFGNRYVYIGEKAFCGIKSLSSVRGNGSRLVLADGAFSGCSALKEISNIEMAAVGEKSFYKCVSLRKVKFSRNLGCIGNEAFRDCSELTVGQWPDKIVHLGARAFENCRGVSRSDCPAPIVMGSGAFTSFAEAGEEKGGM